MPAMPELSSHDILTIVLSLTTISLLLLAHAVNGGGARQFFSCSSIVAGALASLSLFGIDVGINSWQYADPPTQAAQSKSQGAGSPAGGGSNGGGAAAQSGKAGTGGASGRDGNGGSEGQPGGATGTGGDATSGRGITRASFKPASESAGTKPFRDCPDCPEMVPVPAGYAKIVAEIVADCWTPTLANVPADGAPAGGDCSRRVLKDAAWPELAIWSRPSARRSIPAGTARPGVGFRVARDL